MERESLQRVLDGMGSCSIRVLDSDSKSGRIPVSSLDTYYSFNNFNYMLQINNPIVEFIPHNNPHVSEFMKFEGLDKIIPEMEEKLWFRYSQRKQWFTYYQGDRKSSHLVKIMDNRNDFKTIKNIGDILMDMSFFMLEAYRTKTLIDPFSSFGLHLTENLDRNYSGNAELVIFSNERKISRRKESTGYVPVVSDRQYVTYTGDEDVEVPVLKKEVSVKETVSMMRSFLTSKQSNVFLDHFMGLNYGDFIRDNYILREVLLYLRDNLERDEMRFHLGPIPAFSEHVSCSGFSTIYRFR